MNFLQPALLILAVGFAFTPALRAQLKLSAPVATAGNHLQLTLTGASAKAAYVISQTTNQLDWIPVATGAVGQVAFTLPRPAATAVFFRASQTASPPLPIGLMNATDVSTVIAQALTRAAELSTTATVAVVDREGFVLGVWSLQGAAAPALDVIDAITKAGTAAFLSSDQEAFTSRTAGFIVQQHFPPGIENKPTGPLVGVNFSNMSFTDVNRLKDPHTWSPLAFGGGGTNGAPVTPLALSAISGLAGSPGGVPLYKDGHLIGGVGAVVTGLPPIPALADIQVNQVADPDEDAALAGQIGFAPSPVIFGSGVLIDGIRVPYVASSTSLVAVSPLGSLGAAVPPYMITDSPPVNYPTLTNFGGTSNLVGELRAPIIGDPVGCAECLTAVEVTNILALAAQRAAITRAGIRLPAGQPAQVFITVVNNPNADGVPPEILGTWRTPEATIFSWDVAVQKARTALYFSRSNSLFGTNSAISARTVGFLSQAMYPPGIAGTAPGPWLGLQEQFSLVPLATPLLVTPANPTGAITNPLNGVTFTTNDLPSAVNPNLPNGLTIFPGGFPLYRKGRLIGAIGVSGDGIDQDDLIAASGTVNFLPPPAIRADQFTFRGARLPYAKFPRNPSL